MRLGFRQTLTYAENEIYSTGPTLDQPTIQKDSTETYDVFDVLKFTYKWDKATIEDKTGWSCDDGHVDNPNSVNAQIDMYNDTLKDSFTMDLGQDCVVDQDKSSVDLNVNGYANFKVHFIRQLETRGEINDVVLSTGESVKIDYMYKTKNNSDKRPYDRLVELTLLSGAEKLALMTSSLLALLAIQI